MAMAVGTRAIVGRTATLATMTAIPSSSPALFLGVRSRKPFSSGDSKLSISIPSIFILSKQGNPTPNSISSKASFAPLAGLGRGLTCASPSPSSPSGTAQRQQSSSSPTSSATVDREVATSPTAGGAPEVDVDALDIRVGKVLRAWKHPEADSLYVEEVDLAEPEGPRTICSGLVQYIPLEELQGRAVLVLANLKARNMRGVKSNGMLLAASNQEHSVIQLLSPPEGATPGERAWFGEPADQENQSPAGTPNQVQKKKLWETVQPLLRTNDECVATFQSNVMRTSTGVVRCHSLQGAGIS